MALTLQEIGINGRFIKLYEELINQKVVKSKRDFMTSIGLPEQYFTRYKNDQQTPSITTLRKVINLFNVNEKWLLDGDGEMFLEDSEGNIQLDFKHNAYMDFRNQKSVDEALQAMYNSLYDDYGKLRNNYNNAMKALEKATKIIEKFKKEYNIKL